MIFLGYGFFKCYLPEQGSRANSSVFAVDRLTHHRNQQYPICLAFSCHSCCSCPTSTYFPHGCQRELLDHEPDWSPIVQRREFMLLSLARQEPSLLELLLAVCPVLGPVSAVFQASSRHLQCLFSLFSFLCTPGGLLFIVPIYYLGKVDPSLRFLSLLLRVLRCSWHRVVYIFVHMSVFLQSQGLSTMPGRSWMLIC